MNNKLGTVKNPLSVIAIFAGIAEISGAAVLPHISPDNQQLYIWFLMSFPFALVILFFITLNWNYKVLYAPSDFQNEDNFVDLQKASFSETLSKLKDEVLDDSSDDEEENEIDNKDSVTNLPESNIDLSELKDKVGKSELKLDIGKFSSKEEREEQRQIVRKLNIIRMREERAVESLLLNKIENDLNVTVERDMKYVSSGRRMMFDGIIRNGNNLTAVEARRLNRNTVSMSYWRSVERKYNDFYLSLSESEKKEFSLIYSVITDENVSDLTDFLQNKLSELNFPVSIKVYDFDEIVESEVEKAS
jgi:hypothetical protein